MSDKLLFSESEARDAYRHLAHRASSIGDTELRHMALEHCAALYTCIQLYRRIDQASAALLNAEAYSDVNETARRWLAQGSNLEVIAS